MPSFNVDAWQASRERWCIVIDGREYVARDVSAPQVLAAQLQLQGAGRVQERRILLALLRRAFPRTWRMRWAPQFDPVKLIDGLPPPAFTEVVRSFFGYVTGNPVTSQTVMGHSQNTSLPEHPAPSGTASDLPPTP